MHTAMPPLLQYVFMAWCLIKQEIGFMARYLVKHRDNFTLPYQILCTDILKSEVPRLRMRGAIPPLLQYIFMVWCLIKQDIRLHGAVLS